MFFINFSYRRYGVVENRFCFEGGSSCGPKGEGLYVFITDQGDEITHTLKLAAQGKLTSKRKAVTRKLSGKRINYLLLNEIFLFFSPFNLFHSIVSI